MAFFDFSQAHTRRSLSVLALGAILGLAIAGYGLFTAQGMATRTVPPEAIATVNGRPVLRTDFVTQLQTQFGIPFGESTKAQRDRVLHDMISEELLVQRGLDANLASYDVEVRQALVNGVQLQMFADVLAQQPTAQQLKDYYEKHKRKYTRDATMRLRDLMIAHDSQGSSPDATQSAQSAVEALRGGVALETVMTQFGLRDSGRLVDSGHVDTGDLFDFSAWAQLEAPVYEAASALKTGQISDPITAADGVHIVVMLKREPPQQRELADVSNEVWADIKREAQESVRVANIASLKSKANIKTVPAR